MTTYKEVRLLGMDNLRKLCIEKNWYTLGDNEEYSNLLTKAKKKGITTEDIADMALDIYNHSNHDDFPTITGIMFEISKKCFSLFCKEE